MLLDTHVWLWAMQEPDLLSDKVSDAIADPDNQVWLSVVSLWEVAIKHRLGKLPLAFPYDTLVRISVDESHFVLLPIEARHARATLDLPMIHGDPFDRMLIAQAREGGLTLVTADDQVRAYGGEILWALA